MKIDVKTGLLEMVRYVKSSNMDDRPLGCLPELIVIHNISLPPGCFGGNEIEKFFTNTLDISGHPFYKEIQDLKVSSHLLIRRDGELVQFVPFCQRAWHAGHSEYMGRRDCNDFSIGIELEGTDDSPYETVQYEVLVNVIKSLLEAYPKLSSRHIVGHADIAPERKTDPGPSFNWQYLKDNLYK